MHISNNPMVENQLCRRDIQLQQKEMIVPQNNNDIIENQTEPHVIEDPPVNEVVPNNEHFNNEDRLS